MTEILAGLAWRVMNGRLFWLRPCELFFIILSFKMSELLCLAVSGICLFSPTKVGEIRPVIADGFP